MLRYLYLLKKKRMLEKANLIVEFLNKKNPEHQAPKREINSVKKFLGND